MAESSLLGKSINLGSDQVLDHYCDSCHDTQGEFKPVAGLCLNCDENLCRECYNFHLRPKAFRNHKLVENSTRQKQKPQYKSQQTTEKCPRHHEETLQSYCKTHSQICCKVCLTINHQTCHIEDISKMARNIKDSKDLEDLNKKLSKIKTSFNKNLSKTEANRSTLQSNYLKAKDEMKKLRNEFDRLMTETENQAEIVKEEDLNQNKSVAERSTVIIDQIYKITSSLKKLQGQDNNENIFISMKRAENELQFFEESLNKLDQDNTAREYKFEPDMKLKDLLSQLEVLGRLSFLRATHTSATRPDVSISQQMAKTPTHVKDIIVSDKNLFYHGSVVLPNKQILITDSQNYKVKLIDTNKGTTVSEVNVSGTPRNITKVKSDEFAVLFINPNKIQILNLSQNILSTGREISVNGSGYRLAYNDQDQTFVMPLYDEGRVEIINMNGSVVRTIKTDSKGAKLFGRPNDVALRPDRSGMYVSDSSNNSVTFLSLNGDVKAVYKDNELKLPEGICVQKSGVVYVVGKGSNTVHQIDPNSGEVKLLFNQKDGLDKPYSISYCEVEDKMYVGMLNKSSVKVFEMK